MNKVEKFVRENFDKVKKSGDNYIVSCLFMKIIALVCQFMIKMGTIYAFRATKGAILRI